MKTVKVTPSHFEVRMGYKNLVCRVEWRNKRGYAYVRYHYTAHDITVDQLLDECAQRYQADRVEFQPPLLTLPTVQYHAADYL